MLLYRTGQDRIGQNKCIGVNIVYFASNDKKYFGIKLSGSASDLPANYGR
jgi:hypothetical protein